ncbi:MAG: hypothetical protein J6B79_07575 [Clostridia bacterium]|nr:hypothetical protein [Clostridia bacterium]
MYWLIIISVIMFGLGFLSQEVYGKMRGSSIKISLQFSLFGSIAGLVVLLIVNAFKIEFTLFTLIMALLSTANGIAFTFCSFKALGSINLSVYSLFSMLGGMILPFLQGIIFYGEAFTLAKAICLIFITAALVLTVKKGEKTTNFIYYAGVFVLNGMSGVLTKIFTASALPKTSPAGYTILCALCSIVVSLLLLVIFFRKKEDCPPVNFKNSSVACFKGAINKVANFLLVIALATVESSVQYPMVTGGVMIVSTIICFLGKQKPSKKQVLSIALAFFGTLALFIIPI